MSTHVEPCPFCGGTPKLQNLIDDDDYFVSCTRCEVQQIAIYTEDVAVERWNTRHAPSAVSELVRAAKAEVRARTAEGYHDDFIEDLRAALEAVEKGTK